MRNTQKLKTLVAAREAMTVPGAANAMFARVIQDLGYQAVYVTGAGIANMHLGAPDVGLTTVTEVADTLAAISDAVDLPLIVDADTGFGNAVNTIRTVRLLERAGAAAIQLEDQVFPKKCGHFNGKEVISSGEMVQKIKAAADLAEAGMTGPLTAIEGKFGLFRLFAGDDAAPERFAQSLQDLGTVWHLEQAAYKFHPCCHYLHPFIEAARLLQDEGVTVDTIEWIENGVPQGAAGIICEPWEDQQKASGHLARWSLPVTVAMQFVDGKVDLGSFEMPLSEGVADLAQRSTWRPLEGSAFTKRFDALLRVGVKNGRVLEKHIDDVFGNGSRPPSEEDLAAKFTGNVTRVGSSTAAAALRDALMGLWTANDLSSVSAALRELPNSMEQN